jgi:tol-pal system protein YbgF
MGVRMRRFARPTPALLGAALGVVLTAAPGVAQQGAPGQRPLPAPQAAPKPAPPRDGAQMGEAALRQRIEQLEEQLVDMQVVVGTLESLAKGAPASAAGAAVGRANAGAAAALNAADAGRLDGLETQIQALAAQLENLQEQVRALAGRSGAVAPSSSFAAAEPPGKHPRVGEANPPPPPVGARAGFGAVTVSPGAPGQGQRDDIDQLLTSQPGAALPAAVEPGGGARVAAAPLPGLAPEQDVAPKQLYETAYGYLLQRDYGAAEGAFEDFLQRFPNDPLAGNAQYWLGESLFVRGQYRSAAGAFLKGYQNYGRNAKAPESLLRLAMSLQRLGQKDAACSSFSELASKYPSAPPHVKTSAQAERQKAGC